MSSTVDVAAERAHARVGNLLRGKWTIDALLGVGGMAAVYRATHRNGARVAIKMLHPELSVDAEIRRRFLREGYIANTIGHPAVVSVLDDDVTEDGEVFLVMELLEGEPLDELLERRGGRLSIDEVLRIADQTLDVLAVAHRKGVIHRDLKPQNLFLTLAGEVKLLDFGIAAVRQAAAGGAGERATRAGIPMGTPGFMSPEQAQADWDHVDARADLWALGATMFTLVTGTYLHEAKTFNLQLLQAMTEPAPPVRSVRADLPAAVAEVIDRALAFHKGDRWQDARAMQVATQAARAELGDAVEAQAQAPVAAAVADVRPTVRPPRSPSYPSELRGEVVEIAQGAGRRRSPVPLLVGAGAALIAGAVLAAIVMMRGTEDRPVPPPRAVMAGTGAGPGPVAAERDAGVGATTQAGTPAAAGTKAAPGTKSAAAAGSLAPSGVSAPANPKAGARPKAETRPRKGGDRPRNQDDALFDQRH